MSFIGKFPLPPLHALPQLFFSSHSQVFWLPHTHAHTSLPRPLSRFPSPWFLFQNCFGWRSALERCGGAGPGGCEGAQPPERCCCGVSEPLAACAGAAAPSGRGKPAPPGLSSPQRARLVAKRRKGEITHGAASRHIPILTRFSTRRIPNI